tara:strand:- start:874 stop:1365 length:492 start_codon:yes stop_codon:yes gene_type:complete
MDRQKQCTKCGEFKDLTEFYKTQRGSKCKECTLKITREYKRKKRQNQEHRKKEAIKQKERRIRLWENTLIHDSKHRNGVEHSLTPQDIKDIFKKQKGKCYWFNIPLIPSENRKYPQQPSLDRLDRNKGYTKDNVVLTCYSANIGRNENDVETWVEFLKILGLR